MLIVSVLIIVGLSIYPDAQQPVMEMREMPMQEMIDDSTALRQVPIMQPIQVEILEKEKPFDWKEMISWVIGAVNGVVLLVMNIKNIRKK